MVVIANRMVFAPLFCVFNMMFNPLLEFFFQKACLIPFKNSLKPITIGTNHILDGHNKYVIT
jgi:hypothetical protein